MMRRLGIGMLVLGAVLAVVGLLHPELDAGVFYAGCYGGVAGALLVGASFSPALCACLVAGAFGLAVLGIVPVPRVDRPFAGRSEAAHEQDDRLDSKAPKFDAGFTREAKIGRNVCWVNKSPAVIELAIGEASRGEQAVARQLHPTLGAAARAARDAGMKVLPSVDMVDAIAKDFDDRELAALEEALHPGKQRFLVDLMAELAKRPAGAARDRAAGFLAAAIELGGDRAAADGSAARAEFEADPLRSRPIGFYSGSTLLGKVFRRDRFLQTVFSARDLSAIGTAAALADALAQRPEVRGAYDRYRALTAGLTATESIASLDAMLTARGRAVDVAFWPAATSKENRLFARLYRDRSPTGDVMADLIAAVRDGAVSLEPGAQAGWYDHQLFALEPLLLPGKAQEAPKLLLRGTYKKRLRRAFEAMMTKRRETHVKMLQILGAGSAVRPLPAYPDLAVEPCATSYLRTARGYRFLRQMLGRTLDAAGLEKLADLVARVDGMAARFYGVYLVACEDIGMAPELAPDELPDAEPLPPVDGEPPCQVADLEGLSTGERGRRRAHWQSARRWLATAATAPEMDADQRVIAPILKDLDGTVRYWAVLGAQVTKLRTSYAVPPRVHRHARGEPPPDLSTGPGTMHVAWEAAEYAIPVSVFREVKLGPVPPTREELRAACDRGRTIEGALQELGSPGEGRGFGLALVLLAIAIGAGGWRYRRGPSR